MNKNRYNQIIGELMDRTDRIEEATAEEPVTSEELAQVLASMRNLLAKLVAMPVFDPDRNVHGVIRAASLDTSDHSSIETPGTNATPGCKLVFDCQDGDPYTPSSLCLFDEENRRLYFKDEDGNSVVDVYKDYLLFNEHGLFIITGVRDPYIDVAILTPQ